MIEPLLKNKGMHGTCVELLHDQTVFEDRRMVSPLHRPRLRSVIAPYLPSASKKSSKMIQPVRIRFLFRTFFMLCAVGCLLSCGPGSYRPTFVLTHQSARNTDKLVFSPDSALFLTKSTAEPRKAVLWRVGQSDPIGTIALSDRVLAFTFNDDGDVAIVCSNTVCVQYTVSPFQLTGTYPLSVQPDSILEMGVLPTGKFWVGRKALMHFCDFKTQQCTDTDITASQGSFYPPSGSTQEANSHFSVDGKRLLFRTTDGIQTQRIPSDRDTTFLKKGTFERAAFSVRGDQLVLVARKNPADSQSPLSVLAVDLSNSMLTTTSLVSDVSPGPGFVPIITISQAARVMEIQLSLESFLEVDLGTLAVSRRDFSVKMSKVPCISRLGNQLVYASALSNNDQSALTSCHVINRDQIDLALSSSSDSFVSCIFSPDERRLGIPFTDNFGGGIFIWNITGF